MLKYGAKALPEGGWNTIPRPWMDGALIAGDAGGFLNSLPAEGHPSGDEDRDAGRRDRVRRGARRRHVGTRLRAYSDRIDASAVRAELYPVRNVHQAFGHGLLPGLGFAGLTVAHRRAMARAPARHGRARAHADARRLLRAPARAARRRQTPSSPIACVTFDKLTNVHYSGTRHDEDQPVHLLVQTDVCYSRCGEEYGHPCQRFCPANVYEIVREQRRAAPADQRQQLRALQDVRHHGSVPGHHLGAPRGRRRAAVRRPVTASDVQAGARRGASAGRPPSSARSAIRRSARWATPGAGASRARSTSRASWRRATTR